MKVNRIKILVFLVMLAILVSAVPATAKVERIYYTGSQCPYSVGAPEKEWVSEDGILHQRGISLINSVTSSTPYMAGTNYVLMNLEVDLATGAVHAYGSVELHPDAYTGTWVGNFSTHVSPEGELRGNTALNGTGDLEGMILFNKMSTMTPDPACNNMNNIDMGYIHVP